MNKAARYALLIALVLPVLCYFLVKKSSEEAVAMPRHYYPDSIAVSTVNGKQVTDTIWRKTANFSLTSQLGKVAEDESLRGKILIVDFFFTNCPSICPLMTLNMKRIQESIHNGERVGDRINKNVHFISFSVDPERDSVPRLKYWADRFEINPDQWWLLTGSKKAIYDMAEQQFSLATIDGKGIDTSFIHSDKFILIDTNQVVRGYYSGLDSAALSQLSRDVVLLTLEKDKGKKDFFEGKIQFLIITVLLVLVALGVFLIIFNKKRK